MMDLSALVGLVPAQILGYLTAAVSIAAVLSTVMPAPKTTSGVYFVVYQAVNWIALNFAHAKNLSAPESKGIVGGPGAIAAPQVSTSSVPAPAKAAAT